jgi:hypothetical protein
VLAAAARETRRCGEVRIAAEHLLLGVLADESGGAADVLGILGVDPEAVRAAVGGAPRDAKTAP